MTTSQAARLIGCSSGQVRMLIRMGKLKAKRKPLTRSDGKLCGYGYHITPYEARRYRDTEQTQGWPRGQKRN